MVRSWHSQRFSFFPVFPRKRQLFMPFQEIQSETSPHFSYAKEKSQLKLLLPETEKTEKFPKNRKQGQLILSGNRDFRRLYDKQCPENFIPQAHFFPRLPAFSMFSFRETYVSAVENVRFPAGKHTFLIPET